MIALRVKGYHSQFKSRIKVGGKTVGEMSLSLTDDCLCMGRWKDCVTHKSILKMWEIHAQHQLPQKYPSWGIQVSVLFCPQDVTDLWYNLGKFESMVPTLQSWDHCFNSGDLRVFLPPDSRLHWGCLQGSQGSHFYCLPAAMVLKDSGPLEATWPAAGYY